MPLNISKANTPPVVPSALKGKRRQCDRNTAGMASSPSYGARLARAGTRAVLSGSLWALLTWQPLHRSSLSVIKCGWALALGEVS